jgi:hypothetical protein
MPQVPWLALAGSPISCSFALVEEAGAALGTAVITSPSIKQPMQILGSLYFLGSVPDREVGFGMRGPGGPLKWSLDHPSNHLMFYSLIKHSGVKQEILSAQDTDEPEGHLARCL